MKTAFIFPGQGSQYVGMGQDFYENYEKSKQVIDLASKVTGLDIPAICFEDNEKINCTEYTQIAMLAVEIAIMEVLKDQGIKADICAGLSLGEYGALAAASVLDYESLFKLIRARGIYMQNACPVGGGMTAVLGLDNETIEKTCAQVVSDTNKPVSVANYNCPGQSVISGDETAVTKASEILKEKGAKRCIPLKVSGPFHSKLLESAGDKLSEEMKGMIFNKPSIPYVTNVGAKIITEEESIPSLLRQQVSSSVYWQQSMELMDKEGVEIFIEIGPGKSLNGFAKKICPDKKAFNIQNVEDMKNVISEIM